jgi:hypothetical protein
MRVRRLPLLVVATASCLAVHVAACTGDDPVFAEDVDGAAPDGQTTLDATNDDSSISSADGAVDAGPPSCFRAPFSTVAPQPELSRAGDDISISFSPDELTVYVASTNDGGPKDIYSATRQPGGTFPTLTPYALLNTTTDDFGVTVNGSNTVLVFSSPRAPAVKTGLFFLKRSTSSMPFTGSPALVTSLDSSEDDSLPSFANGELYFSRGMTPLFRIMRATQAGPGTFGDAGEVTELGKSGTSSLGVVLSGDGLIVYFGSDREGSFDIWTASRAKDTDPFGAVRKLDDPGLNTAALELPSWMSSDGCRLYFISNRMSGVNSDVWLATRTPQ